MRNIIAEVKKALFIFGVIALFMFIGNFKEFAHASEAPKQIRCTVYTLNGTTATGTQTHYGCIAGRREDLGKTAILYEVNEDGSLGEYIGMFTFEDVMGSQAGKAGQAVDVWVHGTDGVKAWQRVHGDHVYIQYIEGRG